jgi:hypothetical protein
MMISQGCFELFCVTLFSLSLIKSRELHERTAFLSTKKFVLKNEGKFNIPDTINNVKVMIGIRENYYSQNEIKEWVMNGKIKKFKR